MPRMRSLFAIAVMLACAAPETESANAPPSTTKRQSLVTEPDAPTTNEPTPAPALTGYPWARLVVPANPVEPLTFALPQATLVELGVKSHRSFTATQPQIWLLAFEFADQAALLAAEPKLLAKLGDGPPYARQTAYTGAWLLVTGFPSDKPVSPEMQFARDDFRGRWAGEE
jgi:hypothetical protein